MGSSNCKEIEYYRGDLNGKDDSSDNSWSDKNDVNGDDGEYYSNDNNRSDNNDVNGFEKYDIYEDDDIPISFEKEVNDDYFQE